MRSCSHWKQPTITESCLIKILHAITKACYKSNRIIHIRCYSVTTMICHFSLLYLQYHKFVVHYILYCNKIHFWTTLKTENKCQVRSIYLIIYLKIIDRPAVSCHTNHIAPTRLWTVHERDAHKIESLVFLNSAHCPFKKSYSSTFINFIWAVLIWYTDH